MKRNSLIKKILAVAVIFLFIGLAFAPNITANVSKPSLETVEFTTEVCGLNGGKQTVTLTQEEAEEVEQLFGSIRAQLNNTETREEAEKVFKEAVIELDKYGLLGGLSVKQAQRLVTGGYYNPRVLKALEKMYGRHKDIFNNNSNFLCLVAGNTSTEDTLSLGLFACLLNHLILVFPYSFYGETFLGMLCVLFLLNLSICFLNPLPFLYTIYLGKTTVDTRGWTRHHPAKGLIFTLGLNGIKTWDGPLWGRIPFSQEMALRLCLSRNSELYRIKT